MQFFSEIELNREQELCLESLLVEQTDVLRVLPTDYGERASFTSYSSKCYNSIGLKEQNKKDVLSAGCQPSRAISGETKCKWCEISFA